MRPTVGQDPAGLLRGIVPRHAPGGQLVVTLAGRSVVDVVAGSEDDAGGPAIVRDTRFDLASLTKVFTATAFMRLVETGLVGLDDPAARILPDIGGRARRAAEITWRHLLSHTAGLPPGLPLVDAAGDIDPRALVLAIEPDRRPGVSIAYSDVGFMLLGFAVEALSGATLDTVIHTLITAPLDLEGTTFRPDPRLPVAVTERCVWRERRLRGEVHDENAFVLGGVAGHAGLFGTAHDIARLGVAFLDRGRPILGEPGVGEMTREQARDGAIRRGLGFSLWSPDPEASSHPFGQRTFGHSGFTGTSLWIDPDRSLVVALLTNAVYRGRALDAFAAARIDIHRTLVDAVDARAFAMEAL